MKYLNDYMDEAQTKAFNDAGAFFAFSNTQFDEAKTEGVKYVQLGAGLISPKENAEALTKRLDTIYEEAVKQDVAENGKKDIIWRELANHECQIVGDPSDCVTRLDGYPITEEEIQAEWPAYYNHCIDNDYF